MGPSWCRSLRLLFLASLLVLSAAALQSSQRTGNRPPELSAADALLARMCDPRSSHPAGVSPLSLCHGLHLRRLHGGGRHHHHRPAPLPLPPPGRGGEEEVDVRYDVAKRLVPTGPNPLHN
ncbi:CLAVATA3/ESR (CLE)-related protein 10-like [Phragmites australis]|uniref:CLAVATA3/ESR (CLE)-related protein 10-like n=1 Tax=Phragmites australis TaxID=29695 RepID=UPI002D787F66|nr:CLAVATA3/ESR (CLE)-related protein 10-like [Phragmites australis]